MAVKRSSGAKKSAVDTMLGPDVSKDQGRVGALVEPLVREALALGGSHSVILAFAAIRHVLRRWSQRKPSLAPRAMAMMMAIRALEPARQSGPRQKSIIQAN